LVVRPAVVPSYVENLAWVEGRCELVDIEVRSVLSRIGGWWVGVCIAAEEPQIFGGLAKSTVPYQLWSAVLN
jgi:hypothetical protein